MSKLVYVALSGGVDSAAAAILLKDRGYDVRGVTLRLKPENLADGDIADAQKVADKLGIPLDIIDERESFKSVTDYFCNAYLQGLTPNPCVFCNPNIKIGKLVDYALKNGADLENRSVQLFKGMIFKAYAVTYYDNPKYTYYYLNAMNQLAFIDIDEVDATKLDEIKYPFRTIRYDLRGNLMAVGIYVSDEERFLYKKDGTLIAHWIGNVGYNAKGRKIGTIEQIKF